MRTQLYFALLFLISSAGCKGQTTEQQEMMGDKEKKGTEATKSAFDGPRIIIDWGEGEKITVSPSYPDNVKWHFHPQSK